MAAISYMECKAFINYLGQGGGGFVENYKIPGDDYAVIAPQFATILTARAYLLSYNWEIVHATISRKDTKGDSSIPINYTFQAQLLDAEAALAAEAQCNDKEASLMYQFDTGTGHVVNRLIRGLRDSWVTDNVTTLTLPDLGPGWALVVSAPADPSATVIANFLKATAFYTRYMEKVPATSPQEYNAIDWTTIRYKRIATRDMGKGFSSRKARRKARI